MFAKTILVFAFFLSFKLYAYDHFLEEIKPMKNLCKMKVNPFDLLVKEDGIFLHKNRHLIRILGVQFENGAYVATAPLNIIEDIFGAWWCYNCQHWNSKFDAICFYCRKPK